jgi:hypothetical protein
MASFPVPLIPVAMLYERAEKKDVGFKRANKLTVKKVLETRRRLDACYDPEELDCVGPRFQQEDGTNIYI